MLLFNSSIGWKSYNVTDGLTLSPPNFFQKGCHWCEYILIQSLSYSYWFFSITYDVIQFHVHKNRDKMLENSMTAMNYHLHILSGMHLFEIHFYKYVNPYAAGGFRPKPCHVGIHSKYRIDASACNRGLKTCGKTKPLIALEHRNYWASMTKWV